MFVIILFGCSVYASLASKRRGTSGYVASMATAFRQYRYPAPPLPPRGLIMRGLIGHLSLVGDELRDLANSDCLTLVTKSETSQLWVVFESLNTDVSGCTSDLQACNDAHALCSESWCLLRFPSSALLQLVQQCGDGNLFLCGMDVEHAVESGC